MVAWPDFCLKGDGGAGEWRGKAGGGGCDILRHLLRAHLEGCCA